MTKDEMINKLKDEYGVEESKSSLRKKNAEELQEMLKQFEGDQEVEEQKEVDKEEKVVEKETEVAGGKEELFSLTTQLKIFKEYIYIAKKKQTNAIKIENLGFGDVYVSDDEVIVGDKNQLIATGESRVIEGETTVRIMSASQPQIRITELK